MNASKIIAGLVLGILASSIAGSQEANLAPGNKGILGYIDSSTGAFRPLSQMGEFDSESLAATSLTGTFVVNFNITIKSAIPTTAPVTCSVSATVAEVSIAGVNLISESAVVVATRTGNMAKCTVSIPYSWTVLDPATAKVSLDFGLSGGKATATTGLLLRTSSGAIAAIPVPANASTTTRTVNAVL